MSYIEDAPIIIVAKQDAIEVDFHLLKVGALVIRFHGRAIDTSLCEITQRQR